MLFAFVALVAMLLESRDIRIVEMVSHVLLCGGAFYYVLKTYQQHKGVTILMFLMAALGIIYNPVIPVNLPNIGWLVTHIVAALLFYLIALRTPIDDSVITREERDEA